MEVGNNFSMNNSVRGNPIGCYERCTFVVDTGAELAIGDNVGISQTALISHCRLSVGNNVKIGGGTCFYTSDLHSLNPKIRNSTEDLKNRNNAPVLISNNVFIGIRCMILKGVTIGENFIIGTGSVVTQSIPANQVWYGNSTRLIRSICFF